MITAEDIKFSQALVRGAELMIENGLTDWKVKLHNKRKVLADCNNFSRTIRYSKHFLKVATKEQLEGVTLHEIAHALVGSGHGHDNVFKLKVLEIGGNRGFANASVDDPVSTHKYNLHCPACGATSRSNRNLDYVCGRCAKTDNVRIRMIASENVLAVIPWPV